MLSMMLRAIDLPANQFLKGKSMAVTWLLKPIRFLSSFISFYVILILTKIFGEHLPLMSFTKFTFGEDTIWFWLRILVLVAAHAQPTYGRGGCRKQKHQKHNVVLPFLAPSLCEIEPSESSTWKCKEQHQGCFIIQCWIIPILYWCKVTLSI